MKERLRAIGALLVKLQAETDMKPEPPLLMIAAGRRPRARRAPKPSVRELALHMAVVDLLKKLALPGWASTHFPSGEARDARTGAKLGVARHPAGRGQPLIPLTGAEAT